MSAITRVCTNTKAKRLFYRNHEKLESCEAWIYGIKGERKGIVSLSPEIFGLPPQIKLLGPVLRRQLKYKIQDEPYGSEENNYVSK